MNFIFFEKHVDFELFLALSTISVNVVSGRKELKSYFDKNLSGSYNLFEFYNERPVYKVSFILSTKRCKL